jgi:hypothetical protein
MTTKSEAIQKTAQFMLAKVDASSDVNHGELEKVANVVSGLISALASGMAIPGGVGMTWGERGKSLMEGGKKILTGHGGEGLRGISEAAAGVTGVSSWANKLPGMAGAYMAGDRYGLGAGLGGVVGQHFLAQSAQPGGYVKGALKGLGDTNAQRLAYQAGQFGTPLAIGKMMDMYSKKDSED